MNECPWETFFGGKVTLSGKFAAAMPERMRDAIDHPAIDVARLRSRSRQDRKLSIGYIDSVGQSSERTVWPLLVG